jgi:abequosyltransferase
MIDTTDGNKIQSARALLTIAIPTYNRSAFLDLCLRQITNQWRGMEQDVEVMVSNNHSSDDTEKIVQAYIARSFPIKYLSNDTNIGAERNLVQCFRAASGRYVLIFSDDDVLLDGALQKIRDVLRRDDYGIVHLHACYYKQSFMEELPKQRNPGEIIIYDDLKLFVNKVNFFLTFISGNIINKSCVGEFDSDQFIGSGLPQLGWTLQAVFNSRRNAYIQEIMLSAKTDNSGGYKLCQVFGTNMNKIFQYFMAQGVPPYYFDIINSHLTRRFFPIWIYLARTTKKNFTSENYFRELYPIFKRYRSFWIYTVPVIVFPGFLLKAARFMKRGTQARLEAIFKKGKKLYNKYGE